MNNPTLTTAVNNALKSYTPLRIWAHTLHVSAQDSTVTLAGTARSHTMKEIAEQLARGVRGVSAVQNQIVTDDDVEVAVAQALAADTNTRTSFPGILVGVVFGVVYLKGQVKSAEIKSAASQVTAGVAGVKTVSNELGIAA